MYTFLGSARILCLVTLLEPRGARTPDRDTAWAAAIQGGDGEALKALFTTYYDELWAYAASMLSDHEQADDVIQDVFLGLWRRHAEWTVRGDGVVRYLYGAVRNRALDLLRATRRQGTLSERARGDAIRDAIGTSALEGAELASAVARAIDALPERCREVFVLSRYRQLPQRDIAATLGITVNTVNVQLGRALRALRDAVANFERGATRDDEGE